MKKLTYISVISVICITSVMRQTNALAQSEESKLPKTISEIKKTFEAPAPDMLDHTLNQVKSMQAPSEAKLEVVETDFYKNPFVPQTPQPVKPVIEEAVQQPSVPRMVTEPTQIPIPTFNVTGLVWNSKKPAAIINGQIVAIGDLVNSWSISNITKDGVNVTYQDQSIWVKPVIDMQTRIRQQSGDGITTNPRNFINRRPN